MTVHPLWLAGKPLATGRAASRKNAWDGSDLGQVSMAGAAEIEAALEAAWRARRAMANLPTAERERVLRAVAAGIEENFGDLALLITAETGKPISLARGEVQRTLSTVHLAAEEARRIPGEVIALDTLAGSENRIGIVRRFPRGVVVAITPFNFPLNLVAHKIAPAIAAGCPFLLKPAPQAPLTALKLGEILAQAGLPEGAFSVLPCANEDAEKLVTDRRAAVLSFTGSASVGWKLRNLADRKQVVLELGGNAAVIVEPDADIEQAAHRIVTGAFAHAGQVCIKVQRVLAHRQIADRLLQRLLELTGQIGMGDPNRSEVLVGPMIDLAAAKRVEAWVDEAVRQGANVLCGGIRDEQFYHPTWLHDVPAEAKVCCEEVFGPVATFSVYDEFEQALQAVNDSAFGLQAGVFSRQLPAVYRAFEALEVGAVIVNDIPTYRVDQMPYGGVKDSGLGREGPRYAIEAYTEPRLLALRP